MARKHFKNRKPVFIAISKSENKKIDVDKLKSSKWLNSEPQRCLTLLADLFTEKKYW